MYAIMRDRGKQHRVAEGERLLIDRLERKKGDTVEFGEVLLVSPETKDGKVLVGAPLVAGAKVRATVLGEKKAKKIIVRFYRRRKDSKRKMGHRETYTQIKIDKIETGA